VPDLTSTSALAPDELPSASNSKLLTRYRSRVEGSKQWREDERYDRTWERLRDIYRLRMFDGLSDQDRIVVAVAFATANVIAPSVAVNYPKITCNATAPDDDHQAKAMIAEGVANYWWRHYGIKTEFRRSVKDFLIYGHGWLKVGWRYKEAQQDRHPDAIAADASAMADQADQYAQQNPHLAGQLPTNDQILASVPTTEAVVTEDRPFVERVSPFDMYIDPEATSLSDARWVCQRIVRPIEEVKVDPRYKAGVARDLQADGALKWQAEKAPKTSKEDQSRVTLYEFYDLARKTVCVFAKAGGGFLVDPAPMPYSFGIPFVMLRNYDVPDQFYPIGDVEAIEPLQNELNQIRSDMSAARKLDVSKYLVRRASLSAGGLEALRSRRPGTAVEVDDDRPFTDIIAPVPRNEASPQLYQESKQIEDDITLVSGVNEYQQGELPEIRRTATEANAITDAANARAADKLATIEEAIAEVAKRLIALGQMYMTGDQAARATNIQGAQVYWHFNADDIQGEFDFDVEAGSTQPHNERQRKQQSLDLLTALSPFMGRLIDPSRVLVHVLQDGFGIQDAPTWMVQGPVPPIPMEKLIELINYADAPPDIKRQIEAQMGFEPSKMGALDPMVTAAHQAAQAAHSGDQATAQNETKVAADAHAKGHDTKGATSDIAPTRQ
jgi:hypothetical protein